MEDNVKNCEEDVLDHSELRLEDAEELEEAMEEEEEKKGETVAAGRLVNPIQTSYRYKLAEILKNLHSPELVIYSDASKVFISLLNGDFGGAVLHEYVQLSPKCTELFEAWKLHLGKPGLSFILSLISVMLSHPDGKSQPVAVKSSLDSVARSIIEDKLEDIYAEINSQESRRQSAVLSLLGSVVRRRIGLASEVAKRFDFKLPTFLKLSGIQMKKVGKDFKHGRRSVTRRAFVRFATSFLEVGNPRLLRWILQQRDMYSGVLRRLADDDADTIIIVLSSLRDKVLIESSLVPPGLRSVLFGSATLEQLSFISGNQMPGPASDIAHDVLVMVCTDPQNGLIPGPGLKGNKKRLLDLMRKLKATEVGNHKQLLLAIVKGKANLCSSYMDEFPYSLEPRPSSSWFSAVSLASDLVSTIDIGAAIATIASHLCDQPLADIGELQDILKCIIPRSFTRSVINKGLLHSDSLVKHGTLRLVFESLKSLDSLITYVDNIIESISVGQESFCVENVFNLHNLPGLGCFAHVDNQLSDIEIVSPPSEEVRTQYWVALKHFVQNEIRAELPDPQVLLKLLSLLSAKYSGIGVKRSGNFPDFQMKKMKLDEDSENINIVISGLDMLPTNNAAEGSTKAIDRPSDQNLELDRDYLSIVFEIWGLIKETSLGNKQKGADSLFQSKLLDVLKFYLRALPIAFEGLFDFFKILPTNPLSLSTSQHQSLLSLLVECTRQSSGNQITVGAPESMYKHLRPLLNILIFSQAKVVRSQAYTLVRAAMVSTGAFDQNLSEIDGWFVFLPGYIKNTDIEQSKGIETLCNQATIVISFLCEAVSTIGNNLFRYLSEMRKLLSGNDNFACFSPLIFCVLQKCLRLLESDSETFKLHERSAISLYVGNTLSLFLQSQVDMRTLPSLIYVILYENFKDHSADKDLMNFQCEWRPLKDLFVFACNILDEQVCTLHPVSGYTIGRSSSLSSVLSIVEELQRQAQGEMVDELAIAFISSILCVAPNDILENLPSVLAIIDLYFTSYLPVLSSIFFQEQKILVSVRELWPKIFFSGLEMVNKPGVAEYLLSRNALILRAHCDATELSASAFCSFLKHSPFFALFSAFLKFSTWDSNLTSIQDVFPPNKMLELLQVKISEGSVDDSISHLKYVLFWTYHMFLAYKEKQSYIVCELLQMCITLVQDILNHLQGVIFNQPGLKAAGLSSAEQYAQVIIELTFNHPIATLYISNPLCFSREFTDEAFGNSISSFLSSLKQSIHPLDHCIVLLLRRFFEFSSILCRALNFSVTHNSVCQSITRVQTNLMQKILLPFREKFEQFVVSKSPGPFLPIFYIFHSLMEFSSPFDLLELVHWIFSKIDSIILGGTSAMEFAVSMGLYIADGSLDKLYSILQEPILKFKSEFSFYGRINSFHASLVPKIIYKIFDFALGLNLEQGDICLLKAVNAVYNHRYEKPSTTLLPLRVLLSSMIFNIPAKMLAYFMQFTSKIKAKTLLLLTEVSPVHMDIFGKMFLSILNNSPTIVNSSDAISMRPFTSTVTSNLKDCLLNESFLLLLPVALSFFISTLVKRGKQGIQSLMKIPLTYGSILLDGFSNWNAFVSREIFQEDYGEFSPGSFEEIDKFYCSSYFGKSVAMLTFFFVLTGSSIKWKKRLKIFRCVCPHLSFFDGKRSVGAEVLAACSFKDSLKFVNEVAAKISFMKLLLFTSECSSQFMVILEEESAKDMSVEKESDQLNRAKLKLMYILVNTLDLIFKQFPLKIIDTAADCATQCCRVFRFLEHLILKEIVWLSKEIQSLLIESSSFDLMNNFIKSSLLHRFEDPVSLKAIHCILVQLSGSKFPFSDVLELVIGHSAFVEIISWNPAMSDSSVFGSAGSLLQPLNSILKLVDISYSLQNVQQSFSHNECTKVGCDDYFAEDVKLELVRLLRILLKDRNPGVGCFNSEDLLSLLLCGYRATQSQIDLEIFHLMHEIELHEGPDNGSMAALDYIWGVAALKMRKDKARDVLFPLKMTSDFKMIEEQKILFRENIPIDSKACAVTVLFLLNNRSLRVSLPSVSIVDDTSINYPKIKTTSEKSIIQPYDPLFILRFSNHSLAMRYLEPLEFSRLGLLAITFASISSSDENVRKLGYECLGRFKVSLEDCQKSKDLLQLQLLLGYIQNGVTEEWQRIPSSIAIFAAEASLTLLDHSQYHFLAISKLLMCSPRVDLKAIPLFQTMLGSSSIYFKTDSLWMLRLLYAGLNSPDDAKLYLRNNILGVVLIYSASSVADDEFKILTLMIVKKCVQSHMLADHLVKELGLLPWLSSLLLLHGERLIGHHGRPSVDVIILILEVVSDLISSTMISEWLQDCALEQLSEFSLLVLELFVCSVKLLKEDVLLVNAMLIVITSTVRLSQQRKIYQRHFNLSLKSLLQLFRAVSVEFGSSRHTIMLGMYAILINTPTPVTSHSHKAMLIKLLTWTIPAALWSNSTKKSLIMDPTSALIILSKEDQSEESLASKLLRWVSASVILGSVLSSRSKICPTSSISRNDNMLSYLEEISIDACEVSEGSSIVNESLAVLILHLQSFVCRRFVLPTVVSALSVLLLGTASSTSGTVKEYLYDNYEAIQSLSSKIRFPTEANLSWRWSFNKPWHDSNKSEMEPLEEEHACQSLLTIFSIAFNVGKSEGLPMLSLEDVQNYGLF